MKEPHVVAPSARSPGRHDEESGLWAYVALLRRRWLIVIGIPSVVVLVTAVVSFFILPTMYEAVAGVVILEARYKVDFDSRIQTEPIQRLAQDTESRRGALQALVTTRQMATLVGERLGETLPPEDRQSGTLLARINTPRLKGDLLEIQVRHTDPGLAAAIANTWAQVYVDYVNGLFARVLESPETISKQVADAEMAYRTAQEELVRFLGDNEIENLQREIDALRRLTDSYKGEQTTGQSAVFNQQLETKREVLRNHYADLVRVEKLLADAKTLQKQLGVGVASPSAALGDALAMMFLRIQAFASSATLPVQLQVSLTEGTEETAEQQAEDIAALIAVLEARRDETQSRIDELSAALLVSKEYEVAASTDDPISRLIEQYTAEMLRLEEQIEREQARKRELNQARDLTWNAYQSLAARQAELTVAAQIQNEEVRLAVEALVPEEPIGKLQNVVLAVMVGLMLGVFGAFFTEFVRGERSGD